MMRTKWAVGETKKKTNNEKGKHKTNQRKRKKKKPVPSLSLQASGGGAGGGGGGRAGGGWFSMLGQRDVVWRAFVALLHVTGRRPSHRELVLALLRDG